MKIEHGKIWCNIKTKFENIHALEIWQQTNSGKYIKSGITTDGNSATFLLTDWFISQQFAVASLRIVTPGMEFCGVTFYNV